MPPQEYILAFPVIHVVSIARPQASIFAASLAVLAAQVVYDPRVEIYLLALALVALHPVQRPWDQPITATALAWTPIPGLVGLAGLYAMEAILVVSAVSSILAKRVHDEYKRRVIVSLVTTSASVVAVCLLY